MQHCAHVVENCGRLQKSDCSDVENSLLNGREIVHLAVCRPNSKKDSYLRDKNLHDYLERQT